MKRLDLIPARLVDAMPSPLWVNGNLFWLFDKDLHFCTGGTRTIELDGVEIGRGQAPFVEYEDGVENEPVTQAAAEGFLRFVGLVAKHLGRTVTFTPTSGETFQWLTRGAEGGDWVEDRMFSVARGEVVVFRITGA